MLPLLVAFSCNAPGDKPGPDDTDTDSDSDTDSDTDTDAPLPEPLLVPRPRMLTMGNGSFQITESTTVTAELGLEDEADALGLRRGAGGEIQLAVDLSVPAQGYRLTVTPSGITIAGSDTAGVFYGVQTLRQILPPASLAGSPRGAVPALTIEDAPAYPSRGFMIDVARHFFTVEEVERQVDLMALHKLNRLHLHLTDDQGWRIEIRSWPLLTTVGGATEVGGGAGGWYSQEDYAEIVAYAAARHVTVVPEIDFPRHANAALASYAQLNASGVAEAPYTGTDALSTSLWLGDADTYDFLYDVWFEVAQMTPGNGIHIGGNDAADVKSYYSYVLAMRDISEDLDHTMIGWDEIGNAALRAPFYAQYSQDADRARTAIERGGEIIASPAEHCAFDRVYDEHAEYGQDGAGPLDTQAAYDWEPEAAGMEGEVAGVEAALFTEFIDSRERMDFMAWPRLAALAEVGWSEDRDWLEFRERLGWHGARLEALGVGYYADPIVTWTAMADAD